LRERKHDEPIADLKLREVLALAPLCLVIVWIGVQPKFFLDRMAPSLDQLTGQAMRAADERGSHASPQETAGMGEGSKVGWAELRRVPPALATELARVP
jgi:hypothetical protein